MMMHPSETGGAITEENNIRNGDEEQVLVLQTPHDLEKLSYLRSGKRYRIRLAQRLFGPPQWTLRWSQRRELFQQLGNFENLTSLIVHGTIMGQVIPGHVLALSMFAPNLRILRVEAGLILDSVTYILDMAEAVLNHKHLVEFSLLQFLNHVIPAESSMYWMDPLLDALSTIPTLETIELRCLSSFMHWETSFLSSRALAQLLTSLDGLRKLELSNLGLGDEQMATISTAARSPLHELILNANDNTKRGLTAILHKIQPCWTKLHIANNVKLSGEQYMILHSHVACYDNQLQDFCCTYPLAFEKEQQRVNLQLSLHRMHLVERYYSVQVTQEEKIQVVAEVTAAEGLQLDHIFTLIREQPTICDVEMNGMTVHAIHSGWKRWILIGLWFLWLHYLLLGRGGDAITFSDFGQRLKGPVSGDPVVAVMEREPTKEANPADGELVVLNRTSLENARARKNLMKRKLEEQMDSAFGPSLSRIDHETSFISPMVNTRQRRLDIQVQQEAILHALEDICHGSSFKTSKSEVANTLVNS